MHHLYLPVMLAIAAFGVFVANSRRKARAGAPIKQNYWVVFVGVLLACSAAVLFGAALMR